MRNEKGYSLEDVSSETRISVQVLRHIEDEAHDKLPDPAFVKGLLRAYAHAVDCDPAQVVESYRKNLTDYKKAAAAAAMKIRTGRRFWMNFMAGLVSFAVLVGLSIFFISDVLEKHPPVEQRQNNGAQEKATVEDNTAQTPVEPDASADPGETETEKWLLSIAGIEETWLKVIVDGQMPHECTLKAGEQLELEANSNFNILVGNAAAVRIRLNDKPVALNGRGKQAATLRLP